MGATSVREGGLRPASAGVERAGGPASELRSGPWLLTGHDGRLLVFALVDGAVLRWTESQVGGPHFTGPDVLPVKGLSHLTVVQGRNRYAHLVGRRVRPGADAVLAVDLMYAIQYQAGRPLSEWRSLGNPMTKRERTAQAGEPSAVVNADGTLHVFVPTAEGRIALRREDTQGRWEPWRDLQVAAALDAPSAASTSTGFVEVLAPSRSGGLTWYQQEPGADLLRGQDVGVVELPGSGTALETSPGRITFYVTDVRSGGMVAVRAGEWPIPLNVTPGDGRHAAAQTVIDGRPCTVLAHRGPEGRVSLGVCGAQNERAGVWWSDTGMPTPGDPTLAVDGLGRVAVLAVGADGALCIARQEHGEGLTLGNWSRI
ncbi:hypothetical protein ACIBI4_24270 [Streptomyces sp. NPDC050418]|uniref:hypothetical protein n=1 Tax=Streptomyces sp. NPDC050418 TaxID=3365612 RepID=UPI00379F53E2